MRDMIHAAPAEFEIVAPPRRAIDAPGRVKSGNDGRSEDDWIREAATCSEPDGLVSGEVRAGRSHSNPPASRATSRSLDELQAELHGLAAFLSFDEMLPLLESLRLTDSEVIELFRLDPERYSRNILVPTPYLQLIAITWLPGQASPIHNHAQSACCVRVVTGEAVETHFAAIGDDEAVPTGSTTHQAGVVFGGGGPDDIHVVANLSQEVTLRTIHLYSPPLPKEAMKIFRKSFPESISSRA